MNVERLLKIRKMILLHPERTDVSAWHERKSWCRTTHCIGGWAQVLFSDRLFDRIFFGIFAKDSSLSMSEMSGLLDMDYLQSIHLFYISHWPRSLREAYNMAGMYRDGRARAQAEIAAQAIDWFIMTHGTEDEVRKARTLAS